MTQDTTRPICGTDKEFTICRDCSGDGFEYEQYDEDDSWHISGLCVTCHGDGNLWVCPNEGKAGHGEETV